MNCGDGAETVERLFFQCSKSECIWKMASLQWDGLQHQQGNFQKWWSAVQEPQKSKDGKEHTALTVDILWHIWKAKNDKEFKNQDRNPKRTQKDWVEFQLAMRTTDQMSTSETTPAIPYEQGASDAK